MSQQTTNRLLTAGLVVMALLVVGSSFTSSKRNDPAPDTSSRATGKSGAEPITTARMRQKILQTGWASLTAQEKQWVRDQYIRVLTTLDTALTFRHRSAHIRGLRRIADE